MSKLLCAALVLVLTGCSGFNWEPQTLEPQTREPIGAYHWNGFNLYDHSGHEVGALVCTPDDGCTAFDFIHNKYATYETYTQVHAWLAASLEEGKP